MDSGESQKISRSVILASAMALKAAKKELRTLMKQKLLNLTSESINAQSKVEPTSSNSRY